MDEQYDEGPILLQKAVDILEGDTPEDLQQRIMIEAEQVILPQAIALIASGRVLITGRRTQINPHPVLGNNPHLRSCNLRLLK